MSLGARRRWLWVAAAAFAALAALGAVAYRMAVASLEGKLVGALGPSSELAGLRVGWSGVSAIGLRIAAPKDWPTPDSFRAERVRIVPTLRSLFSRTYRIRSVIVTKPYLAMLRTRDGKLLALPSLLARAQSPSGAGDSPTSVVLGHIALEDGVLEIFDETVPRPPLRIRLEQIEASLDEVSVPDFRGRSRFQLEGAVKGVAHDGHASLSGWVEIATRDSSAMTRLRSVDLLAFEPYLIREGEAGVRRGSFDLDLRSDVRASRLSAPGRITLSHLELLPEAGATDTFMGIPRRSVLAGLANKKDEIQFDFTLDGDLGNPQFSLNESLSTRLALSLAKTLGVNLSGLAQDVGEVGLEGGEAAEKAAKGAGTTLWNLLRGKSKD